MCGSTNGGFNPVTPLLAASNPASLAVTHSSLFGVSTRSSQIGWTQSCAQTVRRRAGDISLRIIPLMLDETPLPALVADYRGFPLKKHSGLQTIAKQIAGDTNAIQVAKRLHLRLLELIANEFPEDDPIRSLFCPRCGSHDLTPRVVHERVFDETMYEIVCDKCTAELFHRIWHKTRLGLSNGLLAGQWQRRLP